MRFKSITIENFKNVEHGELTFDNPRRPDGPSILALYGQNGSGKSAVVDCFKIFRHLVLGQEIPGKYAYYITSGKESAKIVYRFEIDDESGNKVLVKYIVQFTGKVETFTDEDFIKTHQEAKKTLLEGYEDDDEIKEYLEGDSLLEESHLRLGPGATSTVSIISEEVMYRGANDKKLHTVFSCGQGKKVSPKGLEDALLKFWNSREELDDLYEEMGVFGCYSEEYTSFLYKWGRSVFFSKACMSPVDVSTSKIDPGKLDLSKLYKVRSKSFMYHVQQDTENTALCDEEIEAAERIGQITKGVQRFTRLSAQYNMSVVESKDVESIEDHQSLCFYCSKDAIEDVISKKTLKQFEDESDKEQSDPIFSITKDDYFRKKMDWLLAHGGAIDVSTTDSVTTELFPQETAIINETLSYVNNLVGAVIPGLKLKLHCETLPSTFLEPQQEMDFVYLQSVRENRAIPLSSESRGIQKIISVIFLLIDVYNNKDAIAVIDELDAGIFEFLLGEILEIIAKEGEGQLIFTSHNLRPLEVIDKGYIAFSTTNPNNRYIRLRNVKPTNNMRDYYFRSILLGGQEENVYNYLSKGKLSLAFLKSAKVSEEKNVE